MTEENGRHPALQQAQDAVDNDPARQYLESHTAHHYRRFWKAVMLAPNLETCVALLNGQTVPVNRLDPEWVRRFGLK